MKEKREWEEFEAKKGTKDGETRKGRGQPKDERIETVLEENI